MDRLSVMKAFCRIVERGSIVRAAEDLEVSSGLLSRELKRLEENFGCTLITRTTRTMSLTEHGQRYYEDARRILRDIDEAEERVRAGAGTLSGALRINAPHSFGTTVLATILPRFMQHYPDVQLTLTFDDQVIDMVEGGYDLSIRIRATLPDSGLIARKIASMPQRLFASPDYLKARGAPTIPSDLADHTAISYLLSDVPSSWTMVGPGGTQTVTIEPHLRLGSSIVLCDMIVAGQGIGALPGFISDPMEETGRLVRVLPEWTLPERHIYAVTASRLAADARTLAFIDFLIDALR